MNNGSFSDFLHYCQQRIEKKLTVLLPEKIEPNNQLQKAIRYSVLNGGKRLRPVLSYATAEALGGVTENTDLISMSVELIHSYSLIHDDLPSMDNDALRRNKPTCHIAFGEALAILAGDALQSMAFEQLTKLEGIPPKIPLQLIACLAKAAGAEGMVKGQAIDIASVNQKVSIEELELMHHKKTGAIIHASIAMSALSATHATPEQLAALDTYGSSIGLAFQVQDDILDVIGDTKMIGKRSGADEALHKATYVQLIGLDKAREKAAQLHKTAINALSIFDSNAQHLRAVADYIISRER